MLGGFELNLAAMSLLSLIVGMFLIYNTVSASVARRHREIGILRSLGVTRNEVRALFLGEAIVLGSIGAFLGLAGGLLLARILVGAVAETISSLYVLVNVKQVALDPWTFVIAWTIGLASVVVSAWLPAQAAAQMEPVRALHGGIRAFLPEKSVAALIGQRWLVERESGFPFLGALAGCPFSAFSVALSTGPPWLGFLAAFSVSPGFPFWCRGRSRISARGREDFSARCDVTAERPASKRNWARRIFPAPFSETRSRLRRWRRRWR